MVKIMAMCCVRFYSFFSLLIFHLSFHTFTFYSSILLLSMRMRFNDVLHHARAPVHFALHLFTTINVCLFGMTE